MKNVTHPLQDFESTYYQDDLLMVASFKTVWRVGIKNQYSVTYTFTINTSSKNCRNSEKIVFQSLGYENFNLSRKWNK